MCENWIKFGFDCCKRLVFFLLLYLPIEAWIAWIAKRLSDLNWNSLKHVIRFMRRVPMINFGKGMLFSHYLSLAFFFLTQKELFLLLRNNVHTAKKYASPIYCRPIKCKFNRIEFVYKLQRWLPFCVQSTPIPIPSIAIIHHIIGILSNLCCSELFNNAFRAFFIFSFYTQIG